MFQKPMPPIDRYPDMCWVAMRQQPSMEISARKNHARIVTAFTAGKYTIALTQSINASTIIMARMQLTASKLAKSRHNDKKMEFMHLFYACPLNQGG